MDLETNSRHISVLERMLIDENAEPTDLPLSLLEDITDRFSPDREIGRGGFAVVYKGIVGERMVAVKKLFKTIDVVHENKFHKEVECLMKAKHKNIVRFLGYCAEAHGKAADYEGRFVMANLLNWLLCFEYVPNGNLQKYITDASTGLEWKVRFRMIKEICQGLHYLHMNRILHLDLKPANILLDNSMVPKIADFGLSRYLNEEKTHDTTKHLLGTPGYMAPEFYGGRITFASDIYSLGVIIMEILTGVKGYPEDDNVIESWMSRLEGDTQLEQVRQCTKIGIECMESDPKKRPVAQHIIDMLEEMAGADETGSSSLVEVELGLLEEQSDRERVGGPRLTDIEEYPETDLSDYSQQKEEDADDEQDTKQKAKRKGKSIFSSNSGVLDKLKSWNLFRRNARKNLVRNGGQVPQIRGLKIFAAGELKKITRNFSEMLREGSFAKVYRGTLPDGTMVEVKYFKAHYTSKQFINAVEIQTQMIHKNILKLVGYCLEADVQISVHEYDANGSLNDILHHNQNQMLPIDLRLDIAIGSAEGLRYMHSADIRHGDVKPASILLDEKFIPKISEFDLSRLINVDDSDTAFITGAVGFLDPVFSRTCCLVLANDVYSFGAVLLEVITGKKIIYQNDDNSVCNLVMEYKKNYLEQQNGRVMFDVEIVDPEDIFFLEEIGKLAMECLRHDIEERPDMIEVTNQLMNIRKDRRAQFEYNFLSDSASSP
ncbi:receptor-like serine/threonine-protein kinase ALE2 [Lolium rigidum]|uniref:receptor-like serine/threonine-protein kinase ALE2 n=1 Tax=Lolium rigidum TaxID=89674 RepID=UPI001F5DD82B|nr:receptor-like serine/threonine-protein kinase ALE2 [Lolium rigidum]